MIKAKGQRLLIGALWLTVGTGLTRVMPIFIGMVFARAHNPQAYADFLTFIVGSNLIAAIPLMGVTQLVLSASADFGCMGLLRQFIKPMLLVQGVSSLCLVAFMAIGSESLEKVFSLSSVSLYIYSMGYCVTGMVAAVFNKIGLQAYAGRCWVTAMIISTVFCLVGFLLNVNVEMTLFFLAFGWLMSGCLCVWRGGIILQEQSARNTTLGAVRDSKLVDMKNIIMHGLPSVIFLFGFYWLIERAQGTGNFVHAGAFSLGYQFFSIGLFFPGVLGNMITPRLNDAKNNIENLKKLLVYFFSCYIFIAIVIGFLVYVLLPWLLMAFNIPNERDTRSLVMIFQLAVIIAAPQALLNQWMASERLPRHILMAAVIWLALIIICIQISSSASTMPAWGLVLAYGGSFLYGAVVLFRRIYGKTIRDAVC